MSALHDYTVSKRQVQLREIDDQYNVLTLFKAGPGRMHSKVYTIAVPNYACTLQIYVYFGMVRYKVMPFIHHKLSFTLG